jgi:hypothetical protein
VPITAAPRAGPSRSGVPTTVIRARSESTRNEWAAPPGEETVVWSARALVRAALESAESR